MIEFSLVVIFVKLDISRRTSYPVVGVGHVGCAVAPTVAARRVVERSVLIVFSAGSCD